MPGRRLVDGVAVAPVPEGTFMVERIRPALARFDQAEVRLCQALNRVRRYRPLENLFKLVGRLSDGMCWYALLVCFPAFYGWAGVRATVHMGIVALIGVGVYKLLKNRATRERPYITHDSIDLAGAPLDRYSFPSGHTMHAVSFALLSWYHFPPWALPLAGFGILVALSRVVLGLHYPTDVLAGAVIGGALAAASLVVTTLLGL